MLLTFMLAALWLVCCHGFAVWLARTALPQFVPTSAAQLAQAGVQAIVILGGGLLPHAPEYGAAQPNAQTAARLRYGIFLGRQSGLPMAFSGGVGWGAQESQTSSEADIAQRVARDEYGVVFRWLENQSRDTAENASRLGPVLQPDGIKRIALVTHAWHMPRAAAHFERAGFVVVPAPMGFVLAVNSPWLEWMPSAEGLQASRRVFQEWLALTTMR